MSKKNLFPWRIMNFLLEKVAIFKLMANASREEWTQAEEHLLDFNKTVITVSSSAIVLSFSLIKIGGVNLSKWQIGTAWILFTVSILSGVLLLFTKFITRFADKIGDRRISKKEYSEKEPYTTSLEGTVYYLGVSFMYILAFVELICFLLAFIVLIIAALRSF